MLPDGDKLLLSRVREAAVLAAERYKTTFIGFLDEGGLSLAIDTLKAEGYRNFTFWGGYQSAERCIFGVFAQYEKPSNQLYPITAVRLSYRRSATLCHRDFLGTLMGLGIERRSVGDILVGQGSTTVMLHSDIAPFVLSQLDRVGGEGVKAEVIDCCDIDYRPQFESLRDTVASARIDCVVAALVRASRSQAAELIGNGYVTLRHRVCDSQSDEVRDGDALSIRGCGKFIIDSVSDLTRKGRTVLLARKYI